MLLLHLAFFPLKEKKMSAQEDAALLRAASRAVSQSADNVAEAISRYRSVNPGADPSQIVKSIADHAAAAEAYDTTAQEEYRIMKSNLVGTLEHAAAKQKFAQNARAAIDESAIAKLEYDNFVPGRTRTRTGFGFVNRIRHGGRQLRSAVRALPKTLVNYGEALYNEHPVEGANYAATRYPQRARALAGAAAATAGVLGTTYALYRGLANGIGTGVANVANATIGPIQHGINSALGLNATTTPAPGLLSNPYLQAGAAAGIAGAAGLGAYLYRRNHHRRGSAHSRRRPSTTTTVVEDFVAPDGTLEEVAYNVPTPVAKSPRRHHRRHHPRSAPLSSGKRHRHSKKSKANKSLSSPRRSPRHRRSRRARTV